MMNILSYVGVNLQAEVCIWTLLGIVRTMFDATLFKVNSNLKQVWQMRMPGELSFYVQRVFRTMISGVMLVQCFTVYVYLASYIVLLYPAFLEDRPTLVIPWLLLAAIRSLLCELFSLALGLAICVLLGPARPSCLKFVVQKIATITPSAYMWMLVYWYYYSIKLTAARTSIKSMVLSDGKNDNDGFLELAVRRRRTKSLLTEDELRKIITNSYDDNSHIVKQKSSIHIHLKAKWNSSANNEHENIETHELHPFPINSTKDSDPSSNEDWFNIDVVTPRDADRILDQFVTMLLKIGIYLGKGYTNESMQQLNMNDDTSLKERPTNFDKVENAPLHFHSEEVETPSAVGSNKGTVASYLRDYSQIFMKNSSENKLSLDTKVLSDSNRSIARIKSDSSTKNESQNIQGNSSTEGTRKRATKDITDRESQTLFTKSDNDIQNDNKSLTINANPNTSEPKLSQAQSSSATDSKEELKRDFTENIQGNSIEGISKHDTKDIKEGETRTLFANSEHDYKYDDKSLTVNGDSVLSEARSLEDRPSSATDSKEEL